MKRLFLLCSALLTLQSAFAQLPYWKDTQVTSVGREPSRTEFTSFASRAEALQGTYEDAPFYYSLNGTWQFRYKDTPQEADGPWSEIQVPGNWERQGYGTAIYVNQPYEFQPSNPTPPIIPDATPMGIYQRTFTLPDTWSGRHVYLNLDGAKSGVYVYLNGHEVGYNENSKDRAQFLINDYLTDGENTLTLRIYRWSTGSWLEAQDFWRISGIERDVYLTAQPIDALKDFTVLSTLTDDYKDGVFRLDLQLERHQTAQVNVAYELLDAAGKVVAQGQKSVTDDQASFQATIANAAQWSAEKPNLYTLLICVGGEWTPYRVGFRKFELRGDRFLVNGQSVKFKGVNIHEHNEKAGHYVTKELMRKDLEIMRKNNINAVRTSHYPQSRYFYDLCDEIGLYVYCEANIESHGMYYDLSKGKSLGNNREFLAAHLYRISDMYERCKNFPSVTIWSLGNEAGNGYNFYRAYEWIEEREKGEGKMNRPICYERALWEWNTDMFVPQYPSADWFARVGQKGSDRPIVPSEYSHAMGNSNGGLWKQWQQIYTYEHLQGAFIWDWVDQGFLEHDAQGRPFWTYGGDYGENAPSDANFCCNGIVNPDRTEHPSMAEVKYAYSNVAFRAEDLSSGKIQVLNRFYFTSLDEFQLRYSLAANGKVVKTGLQTLTTAPQQTETITLPLSELDQKEGTSYFLNVEMITLKEDRLIPAGWVIAAEQFELPVSTPARLALKEKKGGPLQVDQLADKIIISSKKLSFVFDTEKGIVTSYKVSGKEYFDNGFGLQPNFWRAPTDNDYGNGMPSRQQVWKLSSKNFKAQAKVETQQENVLLKVDYTLAAGNRFTVAYTLFPTGKVHVQTQFEAAAENTAEVPRIGMRFRTLAASDAFTYFGRGPMENYCDRKAGSFIGLYKSTASGEYFPYVRPQETGHHCDTRWIQLENGLTMEADDVMEFNVLRNTIENLDSAEAVDRPFQWRNLSKNEKNDPAEAKNRLRRQHHINDVITQPFIEVCLDYRQMGVGGYDSWGSRPDPEANIPANKDYQWGFTLYPTK